MEWKYMKERIHSCYVLNKEKDRVYYIYKNYNTSCVEIVIYRINKIYNQKIFYHRVKI